MTEPDIVFCSFNHIYDAALHAECPYCKKIRKNQAVLSRSLGVDIVDESLSIEEISDDATELLKDQNSIEDTDESTVLFVQEDDDERAKGFVKKESEEEVNGTGIQSVSKDTISKKAYKSDKPVLGWLVCNSGRQIGRSFEVVEGINYIGLEDKNVSLMYNSFLKDYISAELNADVLKGEFYISAIGNSKVYINGNRTDKSIVRNYDVLKINSSEFVFVKLMTEFVNWEIKF